MQRSGIKLLKLGGSVFSDKSRPFSLRYHRLMGIAGEIASYTSRGGKLVIVHGGGSFGHYAARIHLDEKGAYDGEAFSQITHFMNEAALRIADALQSEGVETVVFPTHALWWGGDLHINPVEEALGAGVVPLLYGDVIVDNGSIRVISGDEVMLRLSLGMRGVEEALFATDVDGIYTGNPADPSSRLLERIGPEDLKSITASSREGVYEVTGGMAGKIEYIYRIASQGVRVVVFNGLKPGYVEKALRGMLKRCTVVETPRRLGEN